MNSASNRRHTPHDTFCTTTCFLRSPSLKLWNQIQLSRSSPWSLKIIIDFDISFMTKMFLIWPSWHRTNPSRWDKCRRGFNRPCPLNLLIICRILIEHGIIVHFRYTFVSDWLYLLPVSMSFQIAAGGLIWIWFFLFQELAQCHFWIFSLNLF